jgi:hypothetical protein
LPAETHDSRIRDARGTTVEGSPDQPNPSQEPENPRVLRAPLHIPKGELRVAEDLSNLEERSFGWRRKDWGCDGHGGM